MISKSGRIARIAVGAAFVLAVWYFWGSLWALLGFVPIIVGAVGFCPTCMFSKNCSVK